MFSERQSESPPEEPAELEPDALASPEVLPLEVELILEAEHEAGHL